MVRLTQDNPTSPVESIADAPATPAPSPFVVFPWLATQLFMGFVGYRQYDVATNGYLDFLYAVMNALSSGALTRSDFDAMFGDASKEDPFFKFHSRARFAGYSAAGLGLVGTAAAYLLRAVPVFPVIVAFSLLPSIFVLAQAFLSAGNYKLVPTDPDQDSPEDFPGYKEAKHYMLYGSLGAIVVELYAIGMSLKALDVVPATPEPETVAPTQDETTPVELNTW